MNITEKLVAMNNVMDGMVSIIPVGKEEKSKHYHFETFLTLVESYENLLLSYIPLEGNEQCRLISIHKDNIVKMNKRILTETIKGFLKLSEFQLVKTATKVSVKLEGIQHKLNTTKKFYHDNLDAGKIMSKKDDVIDKIVMKIVQKQKESFYSSLAMQQVEHSINTGSLIAVTDAYQGIGKTSALIQKAYEEGYPLLVRYRSEVELAKNRAKEMGIYDIEVYNIGMIGDVVQKGKGFLIDEGLSIDQIKALQRIDGLIAGGFLNI